MRRISPLKTALAVGTLTGFWHLLWAILVGLGWAKPVLDFLLELHFLKISYALAPFSMASAASLVILTFAVGAGFGLLFAVVWNWLTFESEPQWARDVHRPAAFNQPG